MQFNSNMNILALWTSTRSFLFSYFQAILWKQPKCSSTDEWIKKMWHTHTRVRAHTHTHSGILLSHKKNEMMPFEATWMDLEIIILSEIRQIPYDITYT